MTPSSSGNRPRAFTGGFVVDMETEVCASESPISVSSSPTATETEPSQTDQQPTVFLMMLEDGVCASLVPISAEPFSKAEINTNQQTSFVEGSTGIAQGQTAVGFEPGVWYIQH